MLLLPLLPFSFYNFHKRSIKGGNTEKKEINVTNDSFVALRQPRNVAALVSLFLLASRNEIKRSENEKN